MVTTAISKSARVTLRQLCNLGLPAPLLLPSLLPAIRAVVPAEHAAFFYCDSAGQMVNIYAERMLPPDAMTRYYERHYRADASSFSKSYLQLVKASDPVSIRSISVSEKQSEYYRDVMVPLDVGHIMYGVVRAQSQGHDPIGQLSLYRPESSKPFSTVEADALRDVLHYLGRALAPFPFAATVPPGEQVAEEAMAILDVAGNTLFADNDWLRLVRLARGEMITPLKSRDESRALHDFVEGVAKAASAAQKSLHVVDSPWGKFAFRHHLLAGATGNKATALVVSRLAVASIRLTEGAARLQLSSQQREVALMIALGHTNAEIAERLGVSVNTAGYHVKQVFAKLGVHERSEVGRLLRQA